MSLLNSITIAINLILLISVTVFGLIILGLLILSIIETIIEKWWD